MAWAFVGLSCQILNRKFFMKNVLLYSKTRISGRINQWLEFWQFSNQISVLQCVRMYRYYYFNDSFFFNIIHVCIIHMITLCIIDLFWNQRFLLLMLWEVVLLSGTWSQQNEMDYFLLLILENNYAHTVYMKLNSMHRTLQPSSALKDVWTAGAPPLLRKAQTFRSPFVVLNPG